jgi:hypothetical protein
MCVYDTYTLCTDIMYFKYYARIPAPSVHARLQFVLMSWIVVLNVLLMLQHPAGEASYAQLTANLPAPIESIHARIHTRSRKLYASQYRRVVTDSVRLIIKK